MPTATATAVGATMSFYWDWMVESNKTLHWFRELTYGFFCAAVLWCISHSPPDILAVYSGTMENPTHELLAREPALATLLQGL